MITDLLPKTRRLIPRSTCPRELCDFAEWLSTEGYILASIHIHVIYLGQRLPRRLGLMIPVCAPRDVERAFKAPSEGQAIDNGNLPSVDATLRGRNRRRRSRSNCNHVMLFRHVDSHLPLEC